MIKIPDNNNDTFFNTSITSNYKENPLSGYNSNPWLNNNADFNQVNIKDEKGTTEFTATYDTNDSQKTQTEEQEKDRTFPHVSKSMSIVWGLPPISPVEETNKPPVPVTGGMEANSQNTIFKNSFPILSLMPVGLKRPEKNNNYDNNITHLIKNPYRFAIQNKGNISYSLSNSYGESAVEGVFHEAELGFATELIQSAKTFRFLNRFGGNVLNKAREILGEKFGNIVPLNIKEGKDKLGSAPDRIVNTGKEAGGLAADASVFLENGWNMIIQGQKIDIPNIWKGSSAPISQNVNIVLHSAYPNNETDYLYRIIYPLEIIFALSAPYSETKKDKDNDIVTYENPPYLEAEIDGVFKSNLCAIQNCQIEFPFDRMDMINGGRPYLVNIQLTIIDLYNTIVWSDSEGLYAPNGKDIIKNLKTHKNIKSFQPKIHDSYKYYTIPGGSAGGVADLSISSVVDSVMGDNVLLGDAAEVIDTASNIATGVAGADPSAIASQASNIVNNPAYNNNYGKFPPLLTNVPDMSNERYNEIVQDYLNRHVGPDGPDEYMQSSEERWRELILDYSD